MVKKLRTAALNEKERYLNRRKVPFDCNGWANAESYKPLDFELVQVEDEFNKRQMGWWNGHEWDFGMKRIKGLVMAWRVFFDKADRHKF